MIELQSNLALNNLPENKRQSVLNQRIVKDLNTLSSTITEQLSQFTDYYSPTTGQTVFQLSFIPSNSLNVEFYLNGQLQKNQTDYIVLGNVVTFLNKDFIIQNWYTVTVIYTY